MGSYRWGDGLDIAVWLYRRTGEAFLLDLATRMHTLGADWTGDRWSAGALVRVVDGQDRVSVGHGNVVGQDIGPSAGFATLALNAGYRFESGVQLTVGVDNLFDRAYSEHLNLAGNADFGYPADPVRINEPGRTAWLRVAYSY